MYMATNLICNNLGQFTRIAMKNNSKTICVNRLEALKEMVS